MRLQPGVCIMALVHEDIDDDAQWIALLQHSAEVRLLAAKTDFMCKKQGMTLLAAVGSWQMACRASVSRV